MSGPPCAISPGVFSITIVISSALAVLLAWSTFTALANQRRREVGILRAISAHRSHIMKMFLAEAAIISLLGGILGIALGNALIHHLAGDFDLLTRLGAYASFSLLNATYSLAAMLVGIAVCLVGAAIPIVRLARLEPLLAIKEE